MLRAMPFHARAGRQLIPVDIATRSGLGKEDYRARRCTPALRSVIAELAAAASRHLGLARARRAEVPRQALPALLPAIVAQRSLLRLKRAAYNPFDPALALPDPLQSWRLAAAALLNRY
jgi:phytoene synthase